MYNQVGITRTAAFIGATRKERSSILVGMTKTERLAQYNSYSCHIKYYVYLSDDKKRNR